MPGPGPCNTILVLLPCHTMMTSATLLLPSTHCVATLHRFMLDVGLKASLTAWVARWKPVLVLDGPVTLDVATTYAEADPRKLTLVGVSPALPFMDQTTLDTWKVCAFLFSLPLPLSRILCLVFSTLHPDFSSAVEPWCRVLVCACTVASRDHLCWIHGVACLRWLLRRF